jgi:hypothetical protein
MMRKTKRARTETSESESEEVRDWVKEGAIAQMHIAERLAQVVDLMCIWETRERAKERRMVEIGVETEMGTEMEEREVEMVAEGSGSEEESEVGTESETEGGKTEMDEGKEKRMEVDN